VQEGEEMFKRDFSFHPWQLNELNFPRDGDPVQRLKFLLRYAILAPSSHNTQPWRFSVAGDRILVFGDKLKWLKVADADQRELHISTGCALENLIIAAEHFGYGHQVHYFPRSTDGKPFIELILTPGGEPSSFRGQELFDAIMLRRTNREMYEARAVSEEDERRLQACCVEDGITLHMTSDPEIRRRADALVGRADAIQFSDPAFRQELAYWVGQGVFGTPWLFAKLEQLAVSYLDLGKYVAKKDSDLLMSAPVLAVLCSEESDRESQVKVGQVLERIALTAATLGIGIQPMSQLVQVPETKAELARLIPLTSALPQQSFRLGYAETEKEHTPRRRLEETLV
jgi:nitroreductase